MAKGLKVGEWVGIKSSISGKVYAKGYINESLGHGAWNLKLVYPEVSDITGVHSTKLVRIESDLDDNQKKHLKKLFIDLALDTNDTKWLEELSGKEMS